MKKRNISLIVGGLIISLIIFVMLFPQVLTHINPYTIEGVKSAVQNNGSLVIKGAPFPPSKENILGTDSIGRDIFAIIIYGTRLTMELGLLVVLGRFLIALPIGISAGFGNSMCKSVINLFNIIFSTIPALIICILVLRLNFFMDLFKNQSIIAFVIILTVVGWAKLAGVIRERVENILSQPFITGAKAIGKGNLKIAFDHVLPHLSAELVVLTFMEIALTLSMIMQLGFFGLYVGNLRVIADTDGAAAKTLNISYEPEWASMLSSSIPYLTSAPWTVISPAAAFFVSIFGFNLFGEGLREKLQSKNSKYVIYFRRGIQFKIFNRRILKTVAAIAGIVAILISAQVLVKTFVYKAEAKQVSTITDWQFKDQVLIGSKEAEYTSDSLKASLERAGFMPEGQDYIQKYNIDKLYSIKSYKFSINNSEGTRKLELGKDFSLEDFDDYSKNGEVYYAEDIDIFNVKDYDVFDNKFVVLDEQIYSRDAIKGFANKLESQSKALAVIDILKQDDKLPEVISNKKMSDKFLIYITREAAKDLKSASKLALDIKCDSLTGVGRNVVGVLPGSNPRLSKEAIMISLGYNYLAYDKEEAVNRIKMTIELAKRLYDSKQSQGRTIIIAFWDGNLIDQYSGVKYYTEKPLYPLEDTVVNVDLTDMNTFGDTIMLNSQQIPVTRYFSWAFNHEFETNLLKAGIKTQTFINKQSVSEILGIGPDSQQVLYYTGTVPTILTLPVQQDSFNNKKDTVKNKFVDVLLNTITKNNY